CARDQEYDYSWAFDSW
nr:immunoglobulin heavy chain junction region [Macaca mulatta]